MERESWSLSDVCLVFGKPSGWQTATYIAFQYAAEHVGFARQQIKFISETEAFLREYLKKEKTFNIGDKIVSVDCGGYTVDIDAHQILELDDSIGTATRVSSAGILPLKQMRADESRDPPWSKGFLNIRWTTIADMFQKNSIVHIIDGLREFIKRIPTKPTRVVLGGGYLNLPLVEKNLSELGMELNIKFCLHPDEIKTFEVFIFYFLMYPWSPRDEKAKPRMIFEPFREKNVESWALQAYEWLGRVGDPLGSTQVFTVDKKESQWRERNIQTLDDLVWNDTITSWSGHPGPQLWTIPARSEGLQEIETICLKVDFRNKIPDFSAMLHRRGYTDVYRIKYCVELHLDGESLTFVIKTKDKHGDIYSLHLDQRGTIYSVTLKGDCAQLSTDKRRDLFSSTSTESSSNASESNRTTGSSATVSPVTPCRTPPTTPISTSILELELEQLDVDPPSLQLLQGMELPNPFSPSYPKQRQGFKKSPRRRRRKKQKNTAAVTTSNGTHGTPTVLRPDTLDAIGLPLGRPEYTVDEISLLAPPLSQSSAVPDDTIVIAPPRKNVSFLTPVKSR
ncbi:hypothetical protein SBOR_2246 [Sclerotinia borealis F-4128]|uniref:Uncharacterized protein n=1 Tax=Sclerotinia borealis (strain F-4128) TaxID=1432307 RepID=W9CKQ5_SCLBF|nr:hypothetical protein SBOR_2246 [Sclerotinia borealis F-4128]